MFNWDFVPLHKVQQFNYWFPCIMQNYNEFFKKYDTILDTQTKADRILNKMSSRIGGPNESSKLSFPIFENSKFIYSTFVKMTLPLSLQSTINDHRRKQTTSLVEGWPSKGASIVDSPSEAYVLLNKKS